MASRIPLPKNAQERATFDFARTNAFVQKQIAAGMGRGQREHYKGWIPYRSLSSKGTSTRMSGVKIRRTIPLFSYIERDTFYDAEFHRGFLDYWDNYRLPRELTIATAQELKLRHPKYPFSPVPSVMTVDAIITYAGTNGIYKVARDAKSSSDYKKKAVKNKLRISAEACAKFGIEHVVVDENTVGRRRSHTIQWIRSAVIDGLNQGDVQSRLHERVQKDIRSQAYVGSIHEYCLTSDRRAGLREGTSMLHLRSLLWQHKLRIPMDQYQPASLQFPTLAIGIESEAALFTKCNSGA